MAYSLSPWLKPRFFITGTNRPLAGGLLYTYLAGTTTYATTYSDIFGTTNTNPIVLNSDGECDVFLDDLINYRFVLKNSLGVTQFDKDNIQGIGFDKLIMQGYRDAAEAAAISSAASASTATTAKNTAQVYRDECLEYSTSANLAKDNAETAQAQAEAARDATGRYFTYAEGTAAGIAATLDGDVFSVLSADDQYWNLYRNVSGSAVAIGSGNYTKVYFDNVFANVFVNGFVASKTGYIYAWIDSTGALLLGIKSDGTLWSKGKDVTSSVDNATAAFAATDNVFVNGFVASRTGYLYAWVDSTGELLLGIKLDGTLWSKGKDVTSSVDNATAALAATVAAQAAAATVSLGSPRANYLHVFTDSVNRIIGGFKENGDLEVKGVNICTALEDVSTAAATVSLGSPRANYLHVFIDNVNRILGGFKENGDLEVKGVNICTTLEDVPTITSLNIPSTNIVIFGDSLTEGTGSGGSTVGVQLQALYSDGRTVTSFGYGGQNINSILCRQGSAPTQVTLPVNVRGFCEVPASTTPVSVTVTNSPLGYADITQAKSITGTLAGIAGTLTRTANTNDYTFTRTSAGSALEVEAGLPFIPDTAIYKKYTTFCWIGTNNMTTASNENTIFAGIQKYLSFQDTVQKRFIVAMPAIDSLSGSLATIKANYDALLPLVKAAYPTEYIDTRALLQRNHDGSANDLADVAAGLMPRSLLYTDRYHLNATGYGIVAAEVKRLLDLKGF